MNNEIIHIDGTNWLVRYAKSEDDAKHAIAMARCSGSIGGKHVTNDNGVESVDADVVRLNPDGTECKPYGGA